MSFRTTPKQLFGDVSHDFTKNEPYVTTIGEPTLGHSGREGGRADQCLHAVSGHPVGERITVYERDPKTGAVLSVGSTTLEMEAGARLVAGKRIRGKLSVVGGHGGAEGRFDAEVCPAALKSGWWKPARRRCKA